MSEADQADVNNIGHGRSEQKLPPRFYDRVGLNEEDRGFVLTLDDKPAKTPGKSDLCLPSKALGQAIADEWDAQSDVIDPNKMPLSKLCNTAIDLVSGRESLIIADIVNFCKSDLICYRAEEPQELVMKQMAQWDPVLEWAATALGARFKTVFGVMPTEQPEDALEAISKNLAPLNAFALTAIHNMTSLTGSALLVLAHVAGRFDAATCWQASLVDEDYQKSKWGEDEEAKTQLAHRWLEVEASSRLYSLINQD